jgi:hypothetical protein
MKRTGIFAVVFAVLALTAWTGSVFAQSETPVPVAVAVSPDSGQVTAGEELQLSAAVTDSAGEALEAEVTWAVADTSVASIDENGLLKALKAGETLVIASSGALADTVLVYVVAAEEPPVEDTAVATVEIFPEDAETVLGETLQFGAETKNAAGDEVEAEVTWAVADTAVASIDESGLFTPKAAGETLVIAAAGALADTVTVKVAAEVEEPPVETDGFTVALFRKTTDGKVTKFGSASAEGDTVTIGGMPFPLNFLNGTQLYFPEGSLKENISITFTVPKFAKIGKSEVTFDRKTLTGITFEVAVNDTVISPYYFGEPLELSMPYKRGLLTNLGITPESLAMYFANENGDLEDDPGITDIAVDEENNRITGKVAHFSTIVVAPNTEAPSAVNTTAPSAFTVAQNTPNPFNPTTTISFTLAKAGHTTVDVYNVAGQKVSTLVNGNLSAGSHSVTWNAAKFSAGVYFYTVKSGSFTRSMKMTLLK